MKIKQKKKFYNKSNNINEICWNVSPKNNKNISVRKLINVLNNLSNKSIKFNLTKNNDKSAEKTTKRKRRTTIN